MGCVHIYCGDGKGKTTAAVGLAVRMQGCGGYVIAARFLKTDESGEVGALKSLPGIELLPCDRKLRVYLADDRCPEGGSVRLLWSHV